jgi:hypothetical protein
MEPITVKQLFELCEEQIVKGNEDKKIMISQDDEGNGFHYLWYSFSTPEEAGVDELDINEDVAKLEDTIILG